MFHASKQAYTSTNCPFPTQNHLDGNGDMEKVHFVNIYSMLIAKNIDERHIDAEKDAEQ